MGFLLYTALIWSAKNFALQPCWRASLNLCICALKLHIYYYIDNYLKDVILVLSWGAQRYGKFNARKKYQLYRVLKLAIVNFCVYRFSRDTKLCSWELPTICISRNSSQRNGCPNVSLLWVWVFK